MRFKCTVEMLYVSIVIREAGSVDKHSEQDAVKLFHNVGLFKQAAM